MRMRNQKPDPRSLIGWTSIAAAIGLLASASIAHAHGGMAGPDEIGPPLFTSVALGFVCYWLVILWPSSKSKDDAPPAGKRDRNGNRRGKGRSAAKSSDAQDLPRFTKVAGRGRS
jgi:hypothetical protein